jgi:hypothetical protein
MACHDFETIVTFIVWPWFIVINMAMAHGMPTGFPHWYIDHLIM